MTMPDFQVKRLALVLFALGIGAANGAAIAGQLWIIPPSEPTAIVMSGGITMVANDAASLDDKFTALNYSLAEVRDGSRSVPPVLLAHLPKDLAHLSSAPQRKRLFIQSALPLILQTNAEILVQRRRLIDLAGREVRGLAIAAADCQWIEALARDYGAPADDFEALMRRVDIVPPSLAIAQSVEETGWGTSRFALEGNALFGQRTFDKGAGLVPRRRDPDKFHEVRAFNGLKHSVDGYMRNLNTHWGYKAFRAERAALRAAGGQLDGLVLSRTLGTYSERGPAYLETIRLIIRANSLTEFDKARLGDPEVADMPRA
jgi:Bax protein